MASPPVVQRAWALGPMEETLASRLTALHADGRALLRSLKKGSTAVEVCPCCHRRGLVHAGCCWSGGSGPRAGEGGGTFAGGPSTGEARLQACFLPDVLLTRPHALPPVHPF